MSTDHIIQELKESDHKKVRVAVTDIDGVLRGKVMLKEKFLSAVDNGFGFCDVVFGWDMADESYDNTEFTGWHTGYPDAPVRLSLATYRKIPWEDGLPFFLGDFSRSTEDDLAPCPRSLLKHVTAKAEDMGFRPVFSQEFEWFNFKETANSWSEKGYRAPTPLTPGMFGYSILRASQQSPFFNDLFDLLLEFGVPLEGLHTETGPGVYEAAIRHSAALEAGDRAVLFKAGVKEVGARHGIMPSFMAKWSEQLPGCSGHVHQSLWQEDTNTFYDPSATSNMSDLMSSYIAGQLACLPYILPMLAPTINSYKRLVEGAWAPTTLTWAIDNRTTALRALPVSEKAARLETRVPGADVNPYLAMAACLASGLYGIEKKLALDIPASVGNGYEDYRNGKLPSTLEQATAAMKQSEMPVELFGKPFVDHFIRTREWEVRQYHKAVTDWELKRYFEII